MYLNILYVNKRYFNQDNNIGLIVVFAHEITNILSVFKEGIEQA